MRTICKFRQASIAAALAASVVVGCKTTRTEVVDQPSVTESFSGLTRPNHEKTVNIKLALARSLERQGDLTAAQAAYQEVIKLAPKSAPAHHRLAIVYDRQGKHEQADQMYQAVLKLQPGDADAFSDLGYSQYNQRRWAEAEVNLRQAIAINRDHRRAHNNLGLVLAQNGRYEEALAEFREGGTTAAEAHLNVSLVMAMNGRLEEARSACQLALGADPSLQAARMRLAELDDVIAKTAVSRKQETISSQIKLTERSEREHVTADLSTPREATAALKPTSKAVDAKQDYAPPIASKVAASTPGKATVSKGTKPVIADSEVIPASAFKPPVKQDAVVRPKATKTERTPLVWNLLEGSAPDARR